MRREEKRASRERLRSEKYLRLWHSLQRECRAGRRPMENKRMPGLAHNAKYRETRGSSTVGQEHESVTHLASEEKRFMDTAERGRRRDARLGEPATPGTCKKRAPTQDAIKQEWLGFISQEQSFAEHKAAMEKAAREHDAEKRNVEKRLREKVPDISAEKENPLKRGVPIAQATGHKPAAATPEEEDVGGRSLHQQSSPESESASPKTETLGLVDNTC